MELQWLFSSNVLPHLFFINWEVCVPSLEDGGHYRYYPKKKRAYIHTKYFILLEGVFRIHEVDPLSPDDNHLCVLHVSASGGILVPKYTLPPPTTLFRWCHSHVYWHISEDRYYDQKLEVHTSKITN